MKSCDHGLPLIRNRNLNKNLFNAGHGPISRMDNNQYDSICMSNHQPLIYIYCYYSLYTHYIPIIVIIIKPPTRASLLTYPWYSYCTPMIAAQISSVGYLSMNLGSWKIVHIGTTIIKEKWFSTILTVKQMFTFLSFLR